MEDDDDLIARVEQECHANCQDEVYFCRLMRHPVRKLLDHDGAIAQMQIDQAPIRIIAVDMAPRLARALRIASHAVDGGALIRKACEEGPIVISADCLRTVPLGPRLRQLTSGRLVLSGHADRQQASCSVFAFTGVHREDTERLKRVLKSITPSLHRALFSAQQARKSSLLSLTPAERAICRLLMEGAHNKEIAKGLGKSEATVRNQLHALFLKLGVASRTAAAAKLRDLPPVFFPVDVCRKSVRIEHSYY
jgi:DNA-binding CsgD family transcriptional regulator